ncbi:Manganese-transporting ATPase 1 [Sphaceloma murrayae]|uniref:Manganese-transporting ATPase 1 n=1 Tax=Sphaceloma murrayae TaxID=2082308 RepID=A0A2K1R1A1_9PEZI|nr:Manganese-transporting ATPase 1 [Sphaceloma murrayae]
MRLHLYKSTALVRALEKPEMAPLVDSPQVKSASLHNPLPLALHAYIWPFLVIWPAFFAFYLSEERYEKYINGQEWTFVWSGSIVTVQSLIWLSTFWNINLQTLLKTTRASRVEDATLIKIIPAENAGIADVCRIQRDMVGGKRMTSFLFQKRRFIYSKETGSFATLTYALDKEPKPFVRDFQESQGLTTQSHITSLLQHYGPNTFDIPVPSFVELFQEHAVAPFFVFQIFCVGLWMLDDYWYYSLFTLFMLVVFESTVVWQRQRTLGEFRGMTIKPYPIWAYRGKQWIEIDSDALLPGDLVSANRTKEDSGVACDMVLVEGAAIVNEAMLSGESTPVLKDSVQLRPGDARIEPEGLDRNAFLFGGTKVLQITHGTNSDDGAEAVPKVSSGVPPPPDKGAMAIVTKTGFETSQGSLVRTMIYSTERVSANNVEALLFILFLTLFAVAASWYVWTEGVAKDRKRSKLLLDCVLIVTSVVPPELPMELSLAVNTSLAALSKYAIFCTEPFRIPFAGRVDIACFDKTGTLTGEDLVVDGIAGLSLGMPGVKAEADGAQTQLVPIVETGVDTTLVLATAHALVKLDEGDIVGEPMEKATLQSLGWTLGANDTLNSKFASSARSAGLASGYADMVQIKRRFQFSSSLKRQSSVATVVTTNPETGKKTKHSFAGVKGAPETIRNMLVEVPDKYEETFKYFSRNGARVLALAYKYLTKGDEISQKKVNDLKREEVESKLSFAGFLVLQCPLKGDAIQAIRMLNESSHRCVMITGDNPLTAVHVAKQVEIVDRETLILDAPEHDDSGTKVVWRSIDDKTSIDVNPDEPLDPKILKTHDLCVTGYALSKFSGKPAFGEILRHAWVYARVAPKQKEEILLGLKEAGYTTLMAGDGTNDVGALKQAHIGVALLNGTQHDLEKIGKHFRETKMKQVYEKQCEMMKRFNQPNPPVPVHIAHLFPPGPQNPHYDKAMEREQQYKTNVITAATAALQGANGKPSGSANPPEKIETPATTNGSAAPVNGDLIKTDPDEGKSVQEIRKEKAQNAASALAEKMSIAMMEEQLNDDEPPTIKLGDASVAAPFTSKLANVIAIPNIIRQGRCTLVATIQMYKILALNCLISAYSLSVLYLDGIKFGDGQVTISGMLMSVCFLSISRAKPVEQLSKERPQNNIFNPYIIGSVLGQFAVHIITLIYISRYVQQIEPKEDNIDLEKEFKPSLLNSAIYLLQLIQQISTFAINYQGRPFREGIRENRMMYYGILLVTGVAFSCATEFIPEINTQLKLVPFTTAFKTTLTGTMILDFGACYIIEKGLKNLFSDFKPRDIANRRPEQEARDNERRRIKDAEIEAEKERIREEQRQRVEEKKQELLAKWQGRGTAVAR